MSPLYCDNRLILGYPKIRTKVQKDFCEIIKNKYSECEIIMGTSTAGIPHATLVADKLKLPCGYVRGGNKKKHGRCKNIEGINVKGKKVIVIEDLISTGGSSLEVVNALREEGANVLAVISIFSYEFKSAFEAFKEASCLKDSIVTIYEILEEAKNNKILSDDEIKNVIKFLEDPKGWKK